MAKAVSNTETSEGEPLMRLPWKRTTESTIAQSSGDAEMVRSKIATVEREIAQAETELRRVSLEAALSDNPDAGADAVARLNQLRGRRELLQVASQAAEQKEREAADAARHREWQARRRAMRQHLGGLSRDAADVSKALAALQASIRRLEEGGQCIVALLPPPMRTPARPFHELFSPVAMQDLVRLERLRLGDKRSKPERLGNYMQVADPRTGLVRGMTDVLAELTASVKAQFEQSAPQAPSLGASEVQAEAECADKLHDEADQAEQEGATDA